MVFDGCQNDEQLVSLAKSGDMSALERLISVYAGAFHVSETDRLAALGLEPDDLRQEAMIAVIDAVRSYSPARSASFRTFASVCISNRVRSVIRSHSGKKQRPLNESLPLDELSGVEAYDISQFSLKFSEDPEALVIKQEHDRHIWQQIVSVLSEFECAVFRLYLSGYSYEEIAVRLGCGAKSVDNALHRSKLKLKSIEF